MANSVEPRTEKSLWDRFRLMADCIEEGVAVIENGRITLANARLCEILGYSGRELARMGDLDLAAPEEKERLRKTRQEAEGQGLSVDELEFWAVRKDGSRRYLRNRYGRGPHGEADPRLLVLTSDITAQKLPGEVPADRESFLRQILDASPDLVFVKDRDGRYVLVNRRYAEACQRQPEDFVGKDDLDMGWPVELVEGNPEKGFRGNRHDEQEILESGRARSVPAEWLWVADRRRQFSTIKMPLRDAEGRVWGLMGFARDVTAHERVLAHTERVRDVGQALVAADDPESLLRAAAAPAMQAGADVASLLYVDVDADGEPAWTEVVATIGEPVLPAGTRIHLAGMPQFRLPLSSLMQPLMIADVAAAGDGPGKETQRVLQLTHARALAIVPLRIGQRWQGLVTIAWPERHEFSPEEEQLYGMIASQLVARVQAQRLHEKAGHRAMWSQTAADVSQAAASMLDLDELLKRVVGLIHNRFGLYYVGLFLVEQETRGTDQPGTWAVLRVGTGEAGEQMVNEGRRLEIGGESMIGQCLATMQPQIAMDVGQETVRSVSLWLPDTRIELALPLMSRGQVLGALSIQSDQPAAFSDEDIAILQTMADQLAIAIDNARLIGQAQARAEWEQRVRAISERIRRGGDADMILRITVEEMSRMLQASRAIIRLGTRAELDAKPDGSAPDEGWATAASKAR